MRVAVYGGSFNPPHIGHVMVASWLVWTDQADEVWLLPASSHPFAKVLAPFAERVALCEAVTASLPRVSVCTIEGELSAPSYTINTLSALSSRFPDHVFRLVVGADVLPKVDRWRDWASIEARYAPIIVGRQGHAGPPDAVDFPGISSTDVRLRLMRGEPVAQLVPASILAACHRLWPPTS